MGEQLLRWYGECHGLRWMSLRYFNAAGASADAAIGEDCSETLNLVPLVIKATLGLRPPVQVFGTDFPTPDGTAVRDYIHVEDLADGHLARPRSARAAAAPAAAVNLGTGTARRCARSSSGRGAVSGQDGAGRVRRRAAPATPPPSSPTTGSRAQVLGWRPDHELEDIVGLGLALARRPS